MRIVFRQRCRRASYYEHLSGTTATLWRGIARLGTSGIGSFQACLDVYPNARLSIRRPIATQPAVSFSSYGNFENGSSPHGSATSFPCPLLDLRQMPSFIEGSRRRIFALLEVNKVVNIVRLFSTSPFPLSIFLYRLTITLLST